MPFNIKTFRSSLERMMRPSFFEVQITPPPSLALADYPFRMYAHKSEAPSVRINTQESFQLPGPSYKFPYARMYNALNIEFIITEDNGIRQLFEDWMKLIGKTPNAETDDQTFDFTFHKDYVSPKLITRIYKEDSSIAHEYEYLEAFPVEIGSISLDWSMKDQIAYLPVSFDFRYYEQRV